MVFFWIRLKNACTMAFWLAAILIPLTMLALGAVFGGADGLSIQIGVYGDLPIEGRRYDNRKQLRMDVAGRRLEMGYAYSEGKITLYVSPATVTDRVVNLLAAASLLEDIAGEIGADALSFHMEAEREVIQRRVDEILADGPLMERVVILHGEGTTEEFVPFRRLFHGLLALFAQLVAMLCAYGYASQGERDIMCRLRAIAKGKSQKPNARIFGTSRGFRNLPMTKSVLYAITGAGVIFVLTGAVMAMAILPMAWMFAGVWTIHDIPIYFLYVAVVSGLSAVLAYYLPEGAYPGALVFGFVFTALMGGVIFDLREVLESVAFLRFLFPSHYYMLAVVG